MEIEKRVGLSTQYKWKASRLELHKIFLKIHLQRSMALLNVEGGEILEAKITGEEHIRNMDRVKDKKFLEAHTHFFLVSREIKSLCKDMEQIHLLVEILSTKVNNLTLRVDGSEVVVEAATMGILKEVSGL